MPAVARQQSEANGARRCRNHRCDARDGAELRDRTVAAAAGEPQHRPTAFDGNGFHLACGVGRPRIADQVHQRDVLVAVGVEVALREVDAVLGSEGLHRAGLARAPDDRLLHLAGDEPVVVGLELVAQHVRDAQEPGHRLDLHGQRRRAQHDGVAAGHVRAHHGAHLGIDALLDVLDEQSLAEFVEVAERVAVQHASALADEVLELRAAELVVEPGLDHADELADAHLAAAQAILRHEHAGEPGHQGAVQVEEGADLRPLGTGLDLGHRARQAEGGLGLPVLRTHCDALPFDEVVVSAASTVKDAASARASPPRASTSSKPASRHRAHSSGSVIDALSYRVEMVQ